MNIKLPEIIGVAGTNGAGKDTLADLRFARQNARRISLSDFLRKEADKRGLSHDRKNLSTISLEWRTKFGNDALAIIAIDEFRKTRRIEESGLSIVSIRHPGVAKVIQNEGGLIIWIDADREVRYRRVLDANRGRIDDQVSFEEFCIQEDREMNPEPGNNMALDMAGVQEIADVHITNDFSSKEEFEEYLTKLFSL